MASPNVLLLRAPQSEGSPDHYETVFQSSGYAVSSVPVLETVLTNLPGLRRVIGDGSRYASVIITSARACEAWMSVVEGLEHEQEAKKGSSWTSTPFYVVGNATAAALAEISSRYPHSPFTPVDIRGQSSGTSEQLAHFILEDLQQKPAKLLYLTGDKNRDTLPKILEGGQVELESLKVYGTQGSSSFAQDLKDAIASLPAGTCEPLLTEVISFDHLSSITSMVDRFFRTFCRRICHALSARALQFWPRIIVPACCTSRCNRADYLVVSA